MNFIKNIFKNDNKKEVKEETTETVVKKEPKRTKPEVNGKELYRMEKAKKQEAARIKREEEAKKAEEERHAKLLAAKEEDARIQAEREAKKLEEAKKAEETKKPKKEKQVVKKEEESLDLFGFEVKTLTHGMDVTVEIMQEDNTNFYVRAVDNFQDAVLPKEEVNSELTVGSKTMATVYKFYAEEFYVSERRYDNKQATAKVLETIEIGADLAGKVVSFKDPFFNIELEGDIKAICHKRNMDTSFVRSGERFVGNDYTFRVTNKRVRNNRPEIEVDRRVIMNEIIKNVEEKINVDDIITISDLTPNKGGANFTYEGVRGFIPLSEISHNFFSNSESAIKSLPSNVDAKINRIDKRNGDINIIASIKETVTPPWELIEDHYEQGDELTREVSKIKDYGLFFEIDADVYGLLHKNEMSSELLNEFDNVSVGDTVTFIIKQLDVENKKIALTNIIE